MATKMLSEKLGEVEYDNLIVGLTPPKRVGAGKIASTGSISSTRRAPDKCCLAQPDLLKMQLRRWQTSAARRSGWARPWHRPS